MQTIALVNQKGGVGKISSAIKKRVRGRFFVTL